MAKLIDLKCLLLTQFDKWAYHSPHFADLKAERVRPKSHKSLLLCILFASFAIRAALAVGLQSQLDNVWQRDFLIPGDAAGYWELGKKMAAGEPYSIYDRQVMRMPGFSAVLAVPIKLFGNNFLVARLWLAMIGTVACWLVFILGKTLFDSEVGLWAALYAGVSPILAGFSVIVLSETLFAATLVVSLILLARFKQCFDLEPENRSAKWLAFFSGVASAIACFARPSWILFGPACFLLFVITQKSRKLAAIHFAIFLLGITLTIAPWTYRNYQVTGHFVPLTLWMGPSLYDGLNPTATGDSDMTFYESDQLSAELSEYEIDREYRRRSWSFVGENPGRFIELMGNKFVRYWKPWPNAAQFRSNICLCLAVAVFFVPLIGLAGSGFWLNRNQVWILLLTVGPIVYFSAIHLFFVSSLRYRLPAEYPLCVLAAVGFQRILLARRTNQNQNCSSTETC